MRNIALILALILATESAAQLPGPSTRERAVRAVVDSFFAAVERERWDSAAAFVDTTSFGPFVRQAVRNARSYIPAPPMTVERLMAEDSTMPRAVAEWQLRQYRKSEAANGPFPSLTYEFSGIDSPQQLAALSIPQALARFIAAQDERVAIRAAAKRAGCPDTVSSPRTFDKSVIRGVALASDTTAYVIAGTEWFPTSENDPLFDGDRILTLHRRGRAWRLVARGDLLHPTGMGVFGVSCDRK